MIPDYIYHLTTSIRQFSIYIYSQIIFNTRRLNSITILNHINAKNISRLNPIYKIRAIVMSKTLHCFPFAFQNLNVTNKNPIVTK